MKTSRFLNVLALTTMVLFTRVSTPGTLASEVAIGQATRHDATRSTGDQIPAIAEHPSLTAGLVSLPSGAAPSCGNVPKAPVCNRPRCTVEGWVFWPMAKGTRCTLDGKPGVCDGGQVGPPGQIEPDVLGACVPGSFPDCPDTSNSATAEVHNVFELYCEVTKPFPNRTIRVANDINLDLYNRVSDHTVRYLPLAQNVTLIGSRGGLDEGPEIFTSANVPAPIFDLTNPGSRITGIRFRGPSDTAHAGGAPAVTGVLVRAPNIRIDHNEFHSFPNAGVVVSDDNAPPDAGPVGLINGWNAPTVSDNFFHHNQMNELGYGVVSARGAYVYIERNLFDHHRHDITSDGADNTGYFALYNFILPEADDYSEKGCCGFAHWQQHIDVHGQGNPPNDPNDHEHHGGPAGELYVANYNTIRGAQDSLATGVRKAFVLRGTPSISADFSFNILEHANLGDAVTIDCGSDPNCHPNTIPLYTQSNTFHADTSFNLGVGDFDGDGHADIFQATGITWWVSYGGLTEWRSLNAIPTGAETLLASDLGFADIDNDGKTDILARRSDGALIYFSAGSGNPIVLTTSPVSASQLRFGDFDGDHLTDIFRRADSTDWSIWFAKTRTWTVTGSSGIPLSDLRFGDFDGDGRTDVMAVEGGAWSISRGASSPWAYYAPRFVGNLSATVTGDFDGDGKADLAWQDGDVWRFSSRGCVAPASLREGVLYWPPLLSFKVGDFDHDRADDFLTYQSHWTNRLIFDQAFVATKRGSTSLVSSRYEMR